MVYTPLRVINKSRMTGFTHTTQLWNIRCTQTSLTDAMVMVQHGSNTIKSEAVKVVLLHPPAQVWQQEPQHFPARKNTHTRTQAHTFKVRQSKSCELFTHLTVHFRHQRLIFTPTGHSHIDNQTYIMSEMERKWEWTVFSLSTVTKLRRKPIQITSCQTTNQWLTVYG